MQIGCVYFKYFVSLRKAIYRQSMYEISGVWAMIVLILWVLSVYVDEYRYNGESKNIT